MSRRLDRLVSGGFSRRTGSACAQANLERSQALLLRARAARQPTAEINFDPLPTANPARKAYRIPSCSLPLGASTLLVIR